MALPRFKYVREGQQGVYRCFSPCVRRAFLYGFDVLTYRDFSHRKAWLVDRLRFLLAIFAIDVCACSVIEHLYYTMLCGPSIDSYRDSLNDRGTGSQMRGTSDSWKG